MQFNSFEFLIFFPIVLMVYFIIPRKVRYIWLLLSSYCFYMRWNAAYALLLLVSMLITFFAALLIEKQKENAKAKK